MRYDAATVRPVLFEALPPRCLHPRTFCWDVTLAKLPSWPGTVAPHGPRLRPRGCGPEAAAPRVEAAAASCGMIEAAEAAEAVAETVAEGDGAAAVVERGAL